MKSSRVVSLAYNIFCAALLGMIGLSSLSMLNS